MGSGQSGSNDIRVLHTLLLRRAQSVVGLSDLLSGRCYEDAEFQAYRCVSDAGRSLVETIKSIACDAEPMQQVRGQETIF